MKKFVKVASALAFVVLNNLAVHKAIEGWQAEGCSEGQILFWTTAMTCTFIMCWWLISHANDKMEDEL